MDASPQMIASRSTLAIAESEKSFREKSSTCLMITKTMK